MITNVVIKPNANGKTDLYLDDMNVSNIVTNAMIMLEPGESHMMLTLPFKNLYVDNLPMDVYATRYEDKGESDGDSAIDSEDIQHVSYDDAQLGREK